MRTLVETGVLVGVPGRTTGAGTANHSESLATVQAVLAARIDRLPPEESGSSRPLR